MRTFDMTRSPAMGCRVDGMVRPCKIKTRTEDMETKIEGCTFHEFTPEVQERVDQLVAAAVAAERERWRLRILGLQANYEAPACRAALKHAAAYGLQPEA